MDIIGFDSDSARLVNPPPHDFGRLPCLSSGLQLRTLSPSLRGLHNLLNLPLPLSQTMVASSDSFTATFSYKGQSATETDISHQTTKSQLLSLARNTLQVSDGVLIKLLFKGKIIAQDVMATDATNDDEEHNQQPAFADGVAIPKSGAKVIVMATDATKIQILNTGRSDPLMRGFDDERESKKISEPPSFWGSELGKQHKEYKFCRFQECTDASFGTRPGVTTPHAFEARRLLERLATDPGVVAILTSRELVVGTLGEMDPIDDRLMQKKQQEGACLLGYNTNHGMRIDIKLRTDDLSGFRPYNELSATLIHELSHNWVGEHNILFWTNYGQMRCEYLWTHSCLMLGGVFANGKRTSELAGVNEMIQPNTANRVQRSKPLDKPQLMENICKSVIQELAKEMSQHRIPVQLVEPAVLEFSRELMMETKDDIANMDAGGQRLGGASASSSEQSGRTARERALAAAEKRAREASKKN